MKDISPSESATTEGRQPFAELAASWHSHLRASTLSEDNTNAETGEAVVPGAKATVPTFWQARADAGGQPLTTNQGVAVVDIASIAPTVAMTRVTAIRPNCDAGLIRGDEREAAT